MLWCQFAAAATTPKDICPIDRNFVKWFWCRSSYSYHTHCLNLWRKFDLDAEADLDAESSPARIFTLRMQRRVSLGVLNLVENDLRVAGMITSTRWGSGLDRTWRHGNEAMVLCQWARVLSNVSLSPCVCKRFFKWFVCCGYGTHELSSGAQVVCGFNELDTKAQLQWASGGASGRYPGQLLSRKWRSDAGFPAWLLLSLALTCIILFVLLQQNYGGWKKHKTIWAWRRSQCLSTSFVCLLVASIFCLQHQVLWMITSIGAGKTDMAPCVFVRFLIL